MRLLGNTIEFTSLSGKEVTLAVVTPHSLGYAEECVVSVRGRGLAQVSEQDHTLLRELLHAAHLLYLGHYERSGAEYPPWWPDGYCARPLAVKGAIVPYRVRSVGDKHHISIRTSTSTTLLKLTGRVMNGDMILDDT